LRSEEESEFGFLRKRSNGCGLTIGLLSGDLLNINAPLLSVDGDDLAFSSFEGSSHDLDCVTLTDWNGTSFILGSQLLIQVTAHDLSSNAGGSGEMGLS